MFKNVEEAIAWITTRRNSGHTFENFKRFCDKLNNPQNDFYTIHVAGTDGKGSTVTYLRDLLMSQGFKVGTLQSPHYITHLDRIRINNHNIPEDIFLKLLNDNYQMFVENDLSMFEMDYLIMCYYFRQEHVDMAIVEVGIGGRLDATNVVDNTKLSIITTIGYDHMELLGDTLPKICYEKCGIIKDNSIVLTGHLDNECNAVVKNEANRHKAKYCALGNYEDLGDRTFRYDNEIYTINSYAKYQLHNASLAIEAFKLISQDYGFAINLNKAKSALQQSNWPNRFEIVKQKPLVILDGAHNIHGIGASMNSFDQFTGSKCIVFSCLKRKEYQKMIELLNGHADKIILTSFDNDGVIDLKEFNNMETISDYKTAIDMAIKNYDNILICGSLYFLSDVVLNYKF